MRVGLHTTFCLLDVGVWPGGEEIIQVKTMEIYFG